MSDDHADVNNDSLLLEVKKAGSGVEINKTEDASTPSNKVRYVKTAILGMGYFAVGFNLSILGVALPTLAQNINVSIDQISPVIISRGGGYLVGSVIAGTLDGIIDIYITIIGSMLLMSSCLAFVPMALNTAMLFSLTVINAIGLGAFETVGNMYALYLWGEKVSPFLQFIH
uniref:Major facilitator superfamily (MFS) profile domain-containing protein n=1 Tax=Ciona savignyi TaxID=51511 RepID=H2Y5D6_CIOSA